MRFGALDVAADVDAVNRLAVAGAVANETMRLRPVAPFANATANVDTSLGDYFVPKGTTLSCFSAAAGRRFEKLLPTRSRSSLNDGSEHRPARMTCRANIPFGSGPRMCPGRSLALFEMKALLSMMYKSFDVERAGRAEDVTELFGFTMSPAGLKVRLRRERRISRPDPSLSRRRR